MKTYTLRLRSDEEGKITIELPTDASNTEHELVLVVQPVDDKPLEDSDIPPDGTGARHAFEAQKANIRTGGTIDATKAKDILRDEFTDYLLNRKLPDNKDVD